MDFCNHKLSTYEKCFCFFKNQENKSSIKKKCKIAKKKISIILFMHF